MIGVVHGPSPHGRVGFVRPAIIRKSVRSLRRGKQRLESCAFLSVRKIVGVPFERENDVQPDSERDRGLGEQRVRSLGDRRKGDQTTAVLALMRFETRADCGSDFIVSAPEISVPCHPYHKPGTGPVLSHHSLS